EVERVCDRVAILQRGRLVHEQDMHMLRAERRVRVRLKDAAASVPELPGARRQSASDGMLELLYAGPLPPLLGWLASLDAEDVQIEPAGLSDVYHRYHPSES